jgi:integrase
MPAYKDDSKGTWYVSFYFQNWKGERERKLKRGFRTKKEALEWEREFLQKQAADMDMTFAAFVELYSRDMKSRLRLNTWQTKENIIQNKLLPYFGNKGMSEISAKDIIWWQNEMMNLRGKDGKPFSATYLKTLHNQVSAIFNHAVRFYDLKANPAAKAGSVGRKEAKDMLFWTKDEYQKFADAMMDKPISFYAFEILYWCGIRLGELLALTASDFDFTKSTVSISKSYQRINREDIITEPKTPKSNRTIKMPDFLCQEIQEYLKTLYGYASGDRIFPISKSYLHHEMNRGAKQSGVKRIRVHDIRHSHVSHLIELGFSAVAIADRVGHESIDITYRYYG